MVVYCRFSALGSKQGLLLKHVPEILRRVSQIGNRASSAHRPLDPIRSDSASGWRPDPSALLIVRLG